MFKFGRRENLDEYFSSPRKTLKINKKKIIRVAAIVIAIVLVILLVWGVISIIKHQGSRDEMIVKRAARHFLLPVAEKPSVVEIKNSDQLRSEQPFYQGAKDGDFLLIYTDAKKAIIYSLQRDIIINAGPIFAGQEMEGLK